MNYYKIQDELSMEIQNAESYTSKGFLGLYTRYRMALNLREWNIIY